MMKNRSQASATKAVLHPRNVHRERYDLQALGQSYPALVPFVHRNKFGNDSIDFFNPQAVKALNAALLTHHYNVLWDIPTNYLCPPIPGRVDYIHYLADLLADHPTQVFDQKQSNGTSIRCLDIGTGANCIYPLLAASIYNWEVVGSDCEVAALEAANNNLLRNPKLAEHITLRHQANRKAIFEGIIKPDEVYDVTCCNPPFHASAADAQAGSKRKIKNLTGKKVAKATLNFGGQSNELWYPGGEIQFLTQMIQESKRFGSQCFWFTTLVSKQSNLHQVYQQLKAVKATAVRTVEMGQGNKISRIVAWTFLNADQQHAW